jgi:hypothetical protein
MHFPLHWPARHGRKEDHCAPRRAKAPALLLLVALLLSTVLPSGCAAQHTVVFEDAKTERKVTLIAGVDPARPPADKSFATLSPLQVEASLRRLIVRPSHIISFNRLDPQPLLEGAQLEWVRDTMLQLLPALPATQRLQIHFLDRFSKYDVTMEVYGSGPDLLYRFTRLATPPDLPDGGANSRRADFAELQPQTGQQMEESRSIITLRDPVFGGADNGQEQAAVRAEVQRRLDAKRLSKDDVAPIEARLKAQSNLSLTAVTLYLDKLETINRAAEQNLFTPQEAATRKQALLDALPGAPAPPAKP